MSVTPTDGPGDTDGWEAYEREASEPCSHVVVTAVADVMGCSPMDLEPLYRRVDPNALDTLIDRSLDESSKPETERPKRETAVHFDFAGCEVVAMETTINVAPLEILPD